MDVSTQTGTPEYSVETGQNTEMELDIDAWKQKGDTYSSVLDVYGASNLFSEDYMEKYDSIQDEKQKNQTELADYLFSGKRQKEEDHSEKMVNAMFSSELTFAKNKNYTSRYGKQQEYVMIGMFFFILLFVLVLIRYNMYRKEKRQKYVHETDLEIK